MKEASVAPGSLRRGRGFLPDERLPRRHAALLRENAALRQAQAAAEASNQAKSAFLAEMSHEIRTPLHAMAGLLERSLHGPLDARQREYLELMQAASQSLLLLVNDILDYSRIEAGRLDIEHTPFVLRRQLAEVVGLLASEARRKGLAISCRVAPDVPDHLLGDPLRLRQVITNLLGNAIKFTRQGEVALEVALLADQGDDLSCRFSVRDSGIGISQAQQEKLFTPWQQATPATPREYGGSGLGLAIARRLVGLMHGQLWLDSTPGEGSTFHFTACFGRGTPPVMATDLPASPPLPAMAPLCILLVEDNPINRRLAQLALEQAGHCVLPAASGSEAVACLTRQLPDLVLLDLHLPDMDGLDAACRLRRQAALLTGRPLPIIALSAADTLADPVRGQAAGLAGFLHKPLVLGELHAIWQGLAGPARPPLCPDRLLEQIAHDGSLLDEIASLFRRDSARLLAQVEQSIASGDAAAFERHLHTLRGMLHSLAAPAAQEAAEQLADCAGDWSAAAAACQALAEALNLVAGGLTALQRELAARQAAHAVLAQLWHSLRQWLGQAWLHRPRLAWKAGRRFEHTLLRGIAG